MTLTPSMAIIEESSLLALSKVIDSIKIESTSRLHIKQVEVEKENLQLVVLT
jgi:hypothetical protein